MAGSTSRVKYGPHRLDDASMHPINAIPGQIMLARTDRQAGFVTMHGDATIDQNGRVTVSKESEITQAELDAEVAARTAADAALDSAKTDHGVAIAYSIIFG